MVHKWFGSYLPDRTQSVKIADSLSDPQSLIFDVPQGSVLGPILCTMYTKALTKSECIKHHLYADDTQIYVAITPKNASHNIPVLQEFLVAVRDWMALNKLKFHPDKTEFIVFGSTSQRASLKSFFPVDILGNSL